ncbi:MAG: bleomycin resistance protein [Hyphomicrobium sp.]|nr:MAG: bleomycin resistance protein [Hyphomicrobium sp.]
MQAKGLAIVPFVPSGRDFDLALLFFSALGFSTVWQTGDMAGLRFGSAYFMLQNVDIPIWQENQMLTLEVDDLDVYWCEIDALDLPSSYSGVRTRAPHEYPWGRELHIIDPAGVCWHVRQSAQAGK